MLVKTVPQVNPYQNQAKPGEDGKVIQGIKILRNKSQPDQPERVKGEPLEIDAYRNEDQSCKKIEGAQSKEWISEDYGDSN
jgi:hypothetical protein